MLESLASDFRFGVRTLWTSRAFSIVAIVTLALGVGAIFPYKDAHRLVSVEIHGTDDSNPGGLRDVFRS